MRVRAVATPLATALVVAACGSGGSGQSVPDRTYSVALAGMPGAFIAMSPHGSAKATIRIVGATREICWTFGQLVGLSDPTSAEIRAGIRGEYGSVEVQLGQHYSPSGCTAPISSLRLGALGASPEANYVEIDTRRYPTIGAVRAQL